MIIVCDNAALTTNCSLELLDSAPQMFLDTEGTAELASQNGLGLSRSHIFIMVRSRMRLPDEYDPRDFVIEETARCDLRFSCAYNRCPECRRSTQMSALDAAAVIFFMVVLLREGSLVLGEEL